MSNPFVGPQPLSDKDRLFGRDRELSELTQLLTSERIVLLFSPSGAGKSSLIAAANGLLSRMKRNLEVWPLTRVNSPPPGPVSNRFVWSALTGFAGGTQSNEFAETTLAGYAAGRVTQPTLLVFDQFEEILRLDAAGEANIAIKREFFRQLGEMLLDKRIWTLLVLREDYLAQLEPYRRLVPTHLQNRYRIDLLTRDEAMRDMQCTAESAGGSFGEGALEALADNLAKVTVQQPGGETREVTGEYVEPLQLQVVCMELWEKSGGNIELGHVEDGGSVTRALGSYYASSVADVAGGSQRTEYDIRQWIASKLISPARTRDQVRYEEPESEGLKSVLIRPLIDKHHLLRQEPRLGFFWVELAHDRLMGPVTESNREWFESQLGEWEKRARLWEQEQNEGLKQTYLVARAGLAQAAEWATANPNSSVDMAGYLAACEKYEKELDRKRRQQLILWAAAIVSLALAIGAGFEALAARKATESAKEGTAEANFQRWVADGQRLGAEWESKRAEKAQSEAEGAFDEAAGERDAAARERDEAKRQRALAEASGKETLAARLRAEAQQLERQDLLHKATLLAVESWRRAPGPEAYEVLRTVSQRIAKAVFTASEKEPAAGRTAGDTLALNAVPGTTLKAERSTDGLRVADGGKTLLWLDHIHTPGSQVGLNLIFTQAFDPKGIHLVEMFAGYRARESANGKRIMDTEQWVHLFPGVMGPPVIFRCGDDSKRQAPMFWRGAPPMLLVTCQDGTTRGIELPDWTDLSPVTSAPTFSSDGLAVGGQAPLQNWATGSPTGTIRVVVPWQGPESRTLVGPQGVWSFFHASFNSSTGQGGYWMAAGPNRVTIRIEGGAQSLLAFGLDPWQVVVAERAEGRVIQLPKVAGETQKVLRKFAIPLGLENAAVSGDGRFVAITRLGGYAVFDTVAQALVEPTRVLQGPAAAFSPDGRLLAVAGNDPFLRIRNMRTGGTRLFEIKAGVSRLQTHSAFSADGRRIAVLTRDNLVHVFDVESGAEPIRMVAPVALTKLEYPSDTFRARRMAFSPDGKYLQFLVEGEWYAGLVRAPLDPEELVRDACSRVSRNLNPEEWRIYFGTERYRETCPVLNPAARGQAE